MNISKRIIFVLSVAVGALFFVGGFSIWSLGSAHARFDLVQTNVVPSVRDLARIQNEVALLRISAYRTALAATPEQAGAVATDLARQVDAVLVAVAAYAKNDVQGDPADQKLIDLDAADIAIYRGELERFATVLHTGDKGEAAQMLFTGKIRDAGVKLGDDLDKHMDYNVGQGISARVANESAYSTTLWTMTGVILASTGLLAILSIQLYSVVAGGLRRMRDTLRDASASLDVSKRISIPRMDELGESGAAYNDLMDRVSVALTSVSATSESVSTASREIAAGNIDLSARTEEQAASLEETAASMNELTATVRSNADNAKQASMLAGKSSALAQHGSDAVQAMVGTMGQINASSEKIADITGLIEGIAFQTNILALNAAVEAARAGEQGRGFAVVATEVRTLAQRSSSAAKEIKGLIESSADLVSSGSMQAAAVGTTMGEVTLSIKQVTDIVAEIAAASDEQSRGIEQVNAAVGKMDEVTQQNAALVEQAAAATQSLQQQADQLNDAVSVFTISSGYGPIAALSNSKSPFHVGKRPRAGLRRAAATP